MVFRFRVSVLQPSTLHPKESGGGTVQGYLAQKKTPPPLGFVLRTQMPSKARTIQNGAETFTLKQKASIWP